MTTNLPLWAASIASFDTETTGVDPATARIVSAAIVVLGPDGGVTERYDWLLDPGIDIPEQAARVHGITTEVARGSGMDAATGIAQICAQLTEMFDRGFPLVVYNAPYDLTLLGTEAARHGVDLPSPLSPVLDPLIIDKQLDRYRRGKRTLSAVSAHLGIELDRAHDAGDDAVAAGRVLQEIARRNADRLSDDLDELHRLQATWAAAQAENFQAYMRRSRDPKFVADGRWPIRG